MKDFKLYYTPSGFPVCEKLPQLRKRRRGMRREKRKKRKKKDLKLPKP